MEKNCRNETGFIKDGEDMWTWVKKQMHATAEDRSVIFRAIVAHHPIFTLYYNDVMLLFDEFLPELRLFGYDFYFGGLEPMLSYSNYPLD